MVQARCPPGFRIGRAAAELFSSAGFGRIDAVVFELRDAIALPPFVGRHPGADLVKTSWRSNYVASITVSREAEEDVGFREVFIQVDGKDVGMLRFGDSFSQELPAGPHRIRAHNTLFSKTHDVVLKPGEHARFVAINRAGWGTFGLLMMLGAAPVYLTFERAQE
jgi:hypothetical protein